MINSNELRIGNLVYSKYFKEIRIVGLVGNGNVLSYEIDKGGLDGTSGIADAEPIPLTEEWLVKFGFYKQKSIWDNIVYVYTLNNFDVIWNGRSFVFLEIEYKYVHQLQNIYFALTGEELVCK